MAEITEGAAQDFCRSEVKEYARNALELYYLAKRMRNEWYGRNIGSIVTTEYPVQIGDQALTGNEVLLVMNRVDELVTDLEANSNAKLNTLIQMRG